MMSKMHVQTIEDGCLLQIASLKQNNQFPRPKSPQRLSRSPRKMYPETNVNAPPKGGPREADRRGAEAEAGFAAAGAAGDERLGRDKAGLQAAGGARGGTMGGRSGVHFVPRLAVRPLLHDNLLGASREALRRGVAAPPSGSTTPLTGPAPKGRRAAKRAAGTSLSVSPSVFQCHPVSLSVSQCLPVCLSLDYLF